MPKLPPPLAAWGPFYGMRYAFDPSDNGENRGFVYEALNMVPADPINGGAYLRRVGDSQSTVDAANKLLCQYLGVYKARSGFVNVGIFAGEIYTRSGTTWTLKVTTANFATAGVTLSPGALCGCTTYNDLLIVSDGTNIPFSWDGTSGAGGLTSLANVGAACYGQPVVYYAKLFFIKAGSRSTIIWSEENDPTTGYEAGGYTNAWTLNQSGAGALYALAATNDALYFFRAHGIGAIRGAVSPTFSSDGVHDGIASWEGTTSQLGVTVNGEEVYFPNTQTGELCVIVGGRVRHLGGDLQDLIGNTLYSGGTPTTTVARTCLMPYYDAVAIATNYAGQGLSTPVLYLFSTKTKRCIARLTFNLAMATSVAVPMIGQSYEASYNGFGITTAATSDSPAATYTFSSPPVSTSTWYSSSNPPSAFQLTLSPYVAPPFTVAALQEIESVYDVLPKSGASATTVSVAERTVDSTLVDSNTTDVGTVTLTPDTTYRQEVRAVHQFHDRRRNVQLTIRDSGTLRNYPWGVKRVAVRGDLESADQALP